jgi:hypothetical protein
MNETKNMQKGIKMMNTPTQPIYIGDTLQKNADVTVLGEYETLLGEPYYKIQNFDAIEPFFMSIVSSSDHWLFIASTGGLSAGRINAEQALFPYYTVDKITENSENTGHKAILRVKRAGRISLWEPFSDRQRGAYAIVRNLYKNVTGTALIFEEINRDLGLTYRYAWRTSEQFGFVKTAWLINNSDSACQVELLDGLQNILPANITSATQNTFSPLLDAYKRSEVAIETGLAIFALNSTLTDLAEPSESLLATTVAQIGLDRPGYLLSSAQLDRFRAGQAVTTETEIRGQRGAYFVHTTFDLAPQTDRSWYLIVDVQQDGAAVVQLTQRLQGDRGALAQAIEADIVDNQTRLWNIVASADGIQHSNNQLYSAEHFANVMFNVMRGGIFADQYWIASADFVDFVSVRNRLVLQEKSAFFAALPSKIHVTDLQQRAMADGSADLIRLSYSYLPLNFSRRHGDPSRPWNRFSINMKKADGSLKIDYEGNWRDIFQNWEALAYSYPEFTESMITLFLNATTADGYNPYRITQHGIDWEVPEPGNPWANIGYWSDHQIIYLQKLMEVSVKLHPGKLQAFLSRSIFSYANVPYQIKPYANLLENPYNTIEFNWELEREIQARQAEYGSDGKLVFSPDGQVFRVSLAEKLLGLLLAKLSNFVPEGGLWMTTQRPEWNDANNALVGKGLSVVTLAYLQRYVSFCRELFTSSTVSDMPLSSEIQQFFSQMFEVLRQFQPVLTGAFSDEQRRAMMDTLGMVGSGYRWHFYQHGFAGEQIQTPVTDIVAFLNLAEQYIAHSLRANKRADNLYHTYNILHIEPNRASLGYLYVMLEGQVAMLSSGLLSAAESLALLESLRNSALYREDQQSYILYPDRDLPGFLERNSLNPARVAAIELFAKLADAHDKSIISRDIHGVYHFSGHIRNFHDVNKALHLLKSRPEYADLVDAECGKIETLFEATFHHDEFTGRSGTFFAYEGLGSIYWHMIAKLLLAVQETAIRCKNEASAPTLLEKYNDIRQGLSFNKAPDVYGAFPTDPYSHTPKGQGAKQPGMTGLVKELILTRYAELGLAIEDGRLVFDMTMFDPGELPVMHSVFSYLAVDGQQRQIELKPRSVAYSICQTPIVLEAANEMRITVHYSDGASQYFEENSLDNANSEHIFQRDGVIRYLTVSFPVL